MDTNSTQQIQQAIAQAQSIGIAVGQNPSVDSMGAALSLYLFLTDMGKKVSIASPTDPIVELTSLVGIDRVKRTLDTDGGDLIVSFPYVEGEIEKVSYTLESGYLNIVVKAGEQGLSFTENDVQYKHGGGALNVLIVVGAQRLTDLGEVFNPDAFKDTTIINIDNREHNQRFGEVVAINPQAASVSEMVATLLPELGGEYDVDVAQNLLNGITYATDNFQSPRTTYMTFEVAGTLMRKGAVRRVMRTDRGQDRPRQGQQQPRGDRGDRRPQQQMPQQQFGQQRPQQMAQQPQRQQGRMQQHMQRPQQSQPAPMVQEPMNTPMPEPQQEVSQPMEEQAAPQETSQRPPSDWLTPKVYKGSSNIS